MAVKVRFCGLRGRISVPSPRHIALGWNTNCIEVRLGEPLIIIDAGTGIRNLMNSMLKKDIKSFVICCRIRFGIKWRASRFAPAYDPKCEVMIKLGHSIDQGGLKCLLSDQMPQLMLLVQLEVIKIRMDIVNFRTGKNWASGTVLRLKWPCSIIQMDWQGIASNTMGVGFNMPRIRSTCRIRRIRKI